MRQWQALAGITLAGLALRLYGLNAVPLNFDEGATWYFAHMSFGLWTGPHVALEPNPPLFYTLERFALRVCGDHARVLRLAPAFAGTLCIPVAACIAADFGGRRAALAASALVAASPICIAASQDARAYALLTLAALLTILAALRLPAAYAQPPPVARRRASWWLVYVAASLAALFLHDTAVLMLAGVNAMLALVLVGHPADRRGFTRHWLAANAAIALVAGFWVPVVTHQMWTAQVLSWLAVPTLADLRYALMNVYAAPDLRVFQPWADIAVITAGLAGAALHGRNRMVLGLAVFLLLGVPAMSWAISQWRPIMNGKILLWLAPVFLVLVALGCTHARRHAWALTLLILGIQLGGCIGRNANRFDEAFPEVAAMLKAQARNGDALYLDPPAQAVLLGYYGFPLDRLKLFMPQRVNPWFQETGATIVAPDDIAVLRAAPRIWVLTRAAPAEHRALARQLAQADSQALDLRFGHGLLRNARLRNLELSLFVEKSGLPDSRGSGGTPEAAKFH